MEKLSYMHVDVHTLVCRGTFAFCCLAGLFTFVLLSIHDRYQVSLIVHCTIFSEHFSVIELLGNSAHKVEVAHTDIEMGLPVIMWTT